MKALELAMDLLKAIHAKEWLIACSIVAELKEVLNTYKRSC